MGDNKSILFIYISIAFLKLDSSVPVFLDPIYMRSI